MWPGGNLVLAPGVIRSSRAGSGDRVVRDRKSGLAAVSGFHTRVTSLGSQLRCELYNFAKGRQPRPTASRFLPFSTFHPPFWGRGGDLRKYFWASAEPEHFAAGCRNTGLYYRLFLLLAP